MYNSPDSPAMPHIWYLSRPCGLRGLFKGYSSLYLSPYYHRLRRWLMLKLWMRLVTLKLEEWSIGPPKRQVRSQRCKVPSLEVLVQAKCKDSRVSSMHHQVGPPLLGLLWWVSQSCNPMLGLIWVCEFLGALVTPDSHVKLMGSHILRCARKALEHVMILVRQVTLRGDVHRCRDV